MRSQPSFFDDMRLTLDDAIELSIASLTEYGQRYRHWAIAYSGGKDSSATVAFVAWAIKAGRISAPESLTVLYADTRMELPPLQRTAMRLLDALAALLELKPLYAELTLPQHRLRKSEAERRQDGEWSINAQRLGPLTMDARRMALDRILDIQERAGVDLINAEEQARILELIEAGTWPNKWSGDEITGDILIDAVTVTPLGELITQPILFAEGGTAAD